MKNKKSIDEFRYDLNQVKKNIDDIDERLAFFIALSEVKQDLHTYFTDWLEAMR